LKKALELQRRLGGRDSTGFSEKFVPDRAHEERLRALGYVE
jgi:hypothetical protein